MSLSGAGTFEESHCGDGKANRHPWYPPAALTGDPIAEGKLLMRNTLTGQKEPFVPTSKRTVRWYTCGPTVYDSAHVGHARTYLSFDIMRRIMTDYFHYNCLYQINTTDIDDKIILRARQNVLVKNLSEDETVDFDALSAMADKALAEALEKAADKKAKSAKDLEDAVAKSDSKAQKDQEDLLKQAKLKERNLNEDAEEIARAKADPDKDRIKLIAASKSVLADMLDREKGHTITDHSVFNAHARYYEREFMEDMDALGIRPPDVLTRVTEYIPQIIAFIENIVGKGMAYESNGSVYLSIDDFKANGFNYRKLSPAPADSKGGETTEAEMAEGEGALGSDAKEKRSANDFALWKASKPGEPAWDSPWGAGRPGWHIECSVVASDVLGETLDIHSGGEDLKFPHHDNELAQSEACLGCGNGRQWVNYFTHTGHLHIHGLKMSKSLKNFITIRQALENNTARQLRIMFLLQAWDQPMNYSDQTIGDARAKESTIQVFFREVEALTRGDYLAEEVGWRMPEADQRLSDAYLAAQQVVHDSLLDNFNTRDAMIAIMDVISEANVYLRTPGLKPAVLLLRSIAVYVTQILKVFGVVGGSDDFGFGSGGSGGGAANAEAAAEPYIDTLVSFREKVRDAALEAAKGGDAAEAIKAILFTCDELRDEVLPTVGVRLEDRAGGTRWNREDPDVMMKEIAEKKAKETEMKTSKLEKKLAAKEKELDKVKSSMIKPTDLFKTDEFKEWDEAGVPMTLANGDPISGGQIKKKKKLVDKQTKVYNDLMVKTGGSPQELLDATQKEVDSLKHQLSKLSLS
mmetsp:Transcript_35326/g.77392  ORF Transcript_35326/g.77392 Transcript_35326/m.77392 type:complete len:806 (+) Transcript_35326:114-2531(+)